MAEPDPMEVQRMLIGPNQASCSIHDPDSVRRGSREQVIRSVAHRLGVPADEVGVTARREDDKLVFTALWMPKAAA